MVKTQKAVTTQLGENLAPKRKPQIIPVLEQWYRIIGNEGASKSGMCRDCMEKDGEIFIYSTETLEKVPPFHSNCQCTMENCTEEIRESIRARQPEIHETLLDELMKKEYYKYEDIAVPLYSDGEMYYYKVNDKILRVNLGITMGIGILPDGTFIIGDLKDKPDYMYQQVKDLLLRDEIENNFNISKDEKRNRLNMLYKQVRARIKEKYPEMTDEQLEEKFKKGWESVSSDYFKIKDITYKLNDLMEDYTKEKRWNNLKKKIYLQRNLKWLNIFSGGGKEI